MWIEPGGRCYGFPAPGRTFYVVDGDRLRFAGHGVRRCGGCGAIVAADEYGRKIPTCPLCGALH